MAEKRTFDDMKNASPDSRPKLEDASPPTDPQSKGVDYPRKRVSIACEVCRARRTRCDAKKPACSYCTDAGIDCSYRKPNLWDREPLGATRDVLTRLEGRLENVEGSLQSVVASLERMVSKSEDRAVAPIVSPPETVASFHTPASVTHVPQPLETGNHQVEAKPNARPTLPSLSQMTHRQNELGYRMPTLLTFNGPPSMGSFAYNDIPMFFESQLSLENGPRRYQQPTFVSLNSLHIPARRQRGLQCVFASEFLSWYPLFDTETYSAYSSYAESHMFRKIDSMTCITLFSYAIAAVFERKHILYDAGHGDKEEELWSTHATFILEQLEWSVEDTGIERIVCRILQTGYMLSLMRPLRAWTCICAASRDCMLILRTLWRNRSQSYQNQVSRIYWTCYVIETELEICLEAQPSGIRAFQGKIPLPSHASSATDGHLNQGRGLYYLLAIASLRRLLTDAVEAVGFESGSAIYAPLVAIELRKQLQAWYDHLPPSLKFPIDRTVVYDHHSSHLRTQYFSLIATISWPFLLRILETSYLSQNSPNYYCGAAIDPEVEAQAKECLMICVMHLRTVHVTLAHNLIVSHTTVRSTCAVAMVLLLVYPATICGTLLEEIPAAISNAHQALSAWAEVPFMVTPLERLRSLAKSRGIELQNSPYAH